MPTEEGRQISGNGYRVSGKECQPSAIRISSQMSGVSDLTPDTQQPTPNTFLGHING